MPITGPLTIFDKSFVESLSPFEIEEFGLYYSAVCPPTLVSEIIADLKHPNPREGRIPEALVQVLAEKMAMAHGPIPATLRQLVVGNLVGRPVPMAGQVPIDSSEPHVHVNRDGTGVLYDETPQQEMWARWARGNFTGADEKDAIAWRASLEVDLEALRDDWKGFAKALGTPNSLAEVVSAVDAFIVVSRRDYQRELVRLAVSLVRAEGWQSIAAHNFLVDLGGSARVCDYAPYATAVVRLYLVFVTALARGFIGPRRSHQADLQYLFYAPFCMVFVSGDRLHRDLWNAGAVTSDATFIWGPELKADLKERSARRTAMTFDEWATHRRKYGMFPEPIPRSVTNEVWTKYMNPMLARPNSIGAADDIDPNISKKLKEFMDSFDLDRGPRQGA
jgi:hypothetical protein